MCLTSDTVLRRRRSATPISQEELAQHCSKSDSWVAIKGRVYDVTSFGQKHPGGDILYTASGTDATGVFHAFHPASTWTMLQNFYVGDLVGAKKFQEQEFYADIAKMRTELHRLRAFDASKLYYFYKLLTNIFLLMAGVLLVICLRHSVPAVLFGGFIISIFLQQSGWLAHDFLHHQVFKNRLYNNLSGIILGNLFQGFSSTWWKNKHNHHHAVPNVTDTCAGGDPDIQTMPLLLWSEKLIEGEDLYRLPRFLVRNQSLFYFPILGLARMSWLLQSILFMSEPEHSFLGGNKMRAAEIVGLFLHHGFTILLARSIPSVLLGVFFYFFVQMMGGLLIGVVFTVGHNAMEVLTEDQMKSMDFVEMQLRTTRNVTPSWFNDFFTGGLNYQVEHHIWPTIPRHNLPKAAKVLKQFCLKHDIQYHCQGLIEGNQEVCKLIRRLSDSVL
eukprot:Plantae.Rhodophyta-Purpureofilum_apyrenoidigerum.ctg8676.p1 GENE.Plantae.Rhodophyta-Purpureofilum_apyrenoidigerum.ctg8676~~Plantae.Rhodophyta-Purpureofilum_apyrenoidigerum.ctg8676.p1  ORF type:complete len:443 (+),score=63.90 Plantae.Rhodophyta-Purpureofilum_apyrenoidigerum.ctg8676:177-1505(+)